MEFDDCAWRYWVEILHSNCCGGRKIIIRSCVSVSYSQHVAFNSGAIIIKQSIYTNTVIKWWYLWKKILSFLIDYYLFQWLNQSEIRDSILLCPILFLFVLDQLLFLINPLSLQLYSPRNSCHQSHLYSELFKNAANWL